jgi:DNA-binding NarL/FixJ family response regulator
MKRLLIVGSDTFTEHAMRFGLRYSSGVNLLGVIDGQGNIRQAIREAMPHVVMVDGLGDPSEGLARVCEIREEAPQATILLFSASLGDHALNEVLHAGAMVCLSRSPQLSEPAEPPATADGHANGDGKHAPVATTGSSDHHADGRGANGHLRVVPHDAAPVTGAPQTPLCPLTRRELQILRAVSEGHTNARIASDLWVTESTVTFHLSNIYGKLDVSNRTAASRYALVNNLFGEHLKGLKDAEPSPPEIAA